MFMKFPNLRNLYTQMYKGMFLQLAMRTSSLGTPVKHIQSDEITEARDPMMGKVEMPAATAAGLLHPETIQTFCAMRHDAISGNPLSFQ